MKKTSIYAVFEIFFERLFLSILMYCIIIIEARKRAGKVFVKYHQRQYIKIIIHLDTQTGGILQGLCSCLAAGGLNVRSKR